jgi:ketosteroid isomerase-like protein
MPVTHDRTTLARACYEAYERDDRDALERLIADDFAFWSRQDDGIDRATYFERCWPNHETTAGFEYKRLHQISDDEVLVTYEAERQDGSRFRNTEVLTFAGDQLTLVEVYFGWNLRRP